MTPEMPVTPPPPPSDSLSLAISDLSKDIDKVCRSRRVAWFVAAGGWFLAVWCAVVLVAVSSRRDGETSPDPEPIITGVADPLDLTVQGRVAALREYVLTHADDPGSVRFGQFSSVDEGGERAEELNVEPYQAWGVFYRAKNTYGAWQLYKLCITFRRGTGTWCCAADIETAEQYSPRPKE